MGELQGICRSVTWPRSKFTILGKRDDGDTAFRRVSDRENGGEGKSPQHHPDWFVDPASLDTPAKKKQVVALIDGLPQTLVKDVCPFIVSEDHKASVLFD